MAVNASCDSPSANPLIQLADIISVSLSGMDAEDRYQKVRRLTSDRAQLLAEHVDTRDEHKVAVDLGCAYVQGNFYFTRAMNTERRLMTSRVTYLKLLHAASRPELNIDELDAIIRADASVTHLLLKHLGAAVYSFRAPIRSVRHGLALLGQHHIRRFVSLAALAGMVDDKRRELLVTAALRGRFCEQIGGDIMLADRKPELFLLGALSLIDVVLDRSMSRAVDNLPLADDVKRVLTGGESPLRPILEFVTAYERGDWTTCTDITRQHGISTIKALDRYTEATCWATTALAV